MIGWQKLTVTVGMRSMGFFARSLSLGGLEVHLAQLDTVGLHHHVHLLKSFPTRLESSKSAQALLRSASSLFLARFLLSLLLLPCQFFRTLQFPRTASDTMGKFRPALLNLLMPLLSSPDIRIDRAGWIIDRRDNRFVSPNLFGVFSPSTTPQIDSFSTALPFSYLVLTISTKNF
jgi:hypothetical protein